LRAEVVVVHYVVDLPGNPHLNDVSSVVQAEGEFPAGDDTAVGIEVLRAGKYNLTSREYKSTRTNGHWREVTGGIGQFNLIQIDGYSAAVGDLNPFAQRVVYEIGVGHVLGNDEPLTNTGSVFADFPFNAIDVLAGLFISTVHGLWFTDPTGVALVDDYRLYTLRVTGRTYLAEISTFLTVAWVEANAFPLLAYTSVIAANRIGARTAINH